MREASKHPMLLHDKSDDLIASQPCQGERSLITRAKYLTSLRSKIIIKDL